MADTSWVIDDIDRAIYGEAEGLGASLFTLSSKVSSESFIRGKRISNGILAGKFTLNIP
jgi:hypothetical protein